MFPTERGRKRLRAHLKLSIFSSLFLPQAAAEGTETLTIFVRICIQSLILSLDFLLVAIHAGEIRAPTFQMRATFMHFFLVLLQHCTTFLLIQNTISRAEILWH